jgi:hypothetical protein
MSVGGRRFVQANCFVTHAQVGFSILPSHCLPCRLVEIKKQQTVSSLSSKGEAEGVGNSGTAMTVDAVAIGCKAFCEFLLGLYSTKTSLGCLTINKKNGAKVLYGFSFIGKLQ